MKITFIFVDKTRSDYISWGISDYLSRLKHYTSVEIKIVKGTKITRNADKNQIIETESRNIVSKLSTQAYWVALDSSGEEFTSSGLADFLAHLEREGTNEIVFIIGGPLGLAASLLKKCQKTVSLSRLTLTHEMCRLILMEQLYRACTIKAGGKYHK